MLDWTGDKLKTAGAAALEQAAAYLDSLRNRAITPRTSSQAIRAQLDPSLPRTGVPVDDLIQTFSDVIVPNSRHNGHPRFFGYVASPGSAVSAIAELLAATLNANVTSWRSAPAATELEKIVVDWFKQMLGYPADAAGLLTSGGSMANLAGLAASGARHVYASTEAHLSIAKAAKLLRMELHSIPVDARLHMDTRALAQHIEPESCIVASAGTAATGAVDPLAEIAAIAQAHKAHLHIDGAYGALAALAPSTKHLFAALPHADSLSLDPHKWLYTPVGCGCILYRDPEKARRGFSHDADYTRTLGLHGDESFAFWDYGPELSRPFRALPVWMQIQHAGLDALTAAIENNIQCAKHLETLVRASDDFEMAAPVELSIFCFRHKRADNERLLLDLQQAGSSYLSNANIHGRFALRGCVLNYRTTHTDMQTLLDDLRSLAAAAV